MTGDVDIGHGHTMRFFAWDPDRVLNRQYDGLPSIPRAGVIVTHHHAKTGEECSGVVTFDSPTMRQLRGGPLWNVESWDPLTISPSVLCECGDHGFIRSGRWEPA